jgi:hypothetical protein
MIILMFCSSNLCIRLRHDFPFLKPSVERRKIYISVITFYTPAVLPIHLVASGYKTTTQYHKQGYYEVPRPIRVRDPGDHQCMRRRLDRIHLAGLEQGFDSHGDALCKYYESLDSSFLGPIQVPAS